MEATRGPFIRRLAVIAAAFGWTALVVQFYLSLRLAHANGKGLVEGVGIYFSFFTILTNILVALALSLPLMRTHSICVFFELGRHVRQRSFRVMITLLSTTLRTFFLIITSSLLLTGCSNETTPLEQDLAGTGGTSASFVNKVWQVGSSSSVAPGTLYVFLSEGTLLITSPHNKPLLGTWEYDNGELIMVEEGVPYKTDILRLIATEFTIRSNNPGEPVEITLVPAEASPLAK